MDEQTLERLAAVYDEAVTGAHYDTRGRNPYADGVIAATMAALDLSDRDEAEDVLEEHRP